MTTEPQLSPALIPHKQEPVDEEEPDFSGKHLPEKRPKTYHLTTNDQRKKLLDAIAIKGLSVLRVTFFLVCRSVDNTDQKQAANELGIKYSTAKTIWRIYSSEGRVEKKRQRRGLSDAALQHQRLLECLTGKAGPLTVLPLEFFFPGKFIGPDFWGEQLTKHFNTIND